MPLRRKPWLLAMVGVWCWTIPASIAQDSSVKPGINDSFQDPNVDKFVARFEIESREVYKHRRDVVEACRLKPGVTVADIGAGTGLFTRLFAKEVGRKGKVVAVDIAEPFLEHIRKTVRAEKLHNVTTVRCDQKSTRLPAASVDVAFVCDTYHHFEFPSKTLASLMSAIRPGGELIVIDFYRRKEISRPFIMKHVRADKDVFVREIIEAGFEPIDDEPAPKFLRENYLVRFRRPCADRASSSKGDDRSTKRRREPARDGE